MQNNSWYNAQVPKIQEKKNENFSLKMPVSLLQRLGEIAEHEDRPLGYVGRELMVRGLALYEQDGKLRDTATPGPGDRASHGINGVAVPPNGSTIPFDQPAEHEQPRKPKRKTR